MLIEAKDALFGYRKVPVVHVESLTLQPGMPLGIFGPNGSGKTTLIKGLTGLLKALAGEVRRAPDLRIGYLPQHRAMNLHWPMTGFDAASLATSAQKKLGWVLGAKSHIRAAMADMDVENLASRPFAKLSGGQQQRLLLAGALAGQPSILLLDEPTDGLDIRSARLLISALKRQIVKGLCVVLISHDVEELLGLVETVAWVHPAETTEKPGAVELISTSQLIDRVTRARRVS